MRYRTTEGNWLSFDSETETVRNTAQELRKIALHYRNNILMLWAADQLVPRAIGDKTCKPWPHSSNTLAAYAWDLVRWFTPPPSVPLDGFIFTIGEEPVFEKWDDE